MRKKIFIVRHGETDNNQKKILQGGNVDLGLNEKGKLQSEAFYSVYKEVSFKKIYTSTLKRSIESVKGFIEKGVPLEHSPLLNEISYGIYDGIATSEGENSFYRLIVNEWTKGNITAKIEGGESPIEVQERILRFLGQILGRENEDLILICMHGRAMRIFIATVLHYDLSLMEIFKHANLGLYVLNYVDGIFSVEKFNDTAHLSHSSSLNVFKINP